MGADAASLRRRLMLAFQMSYLLLVLLTQLDHHLLLLRYRLLVLFVLRDDNFKVLDLLCRKLNQLIYL